jgi:hypothetical protein
MGMDKLTRIHQRATIMVRTIARSERLREVKMTIMVVRTIARSERLREVKSSCTQGPEVDTKSLEVGEGHKAIAEPADKKLVHELQLLQTLFRQTCRCRAPPQTAATPYPPN